MAGERILIVDDSEENVVFMREFLGEHGYTYTVARNGTEALEAMRADPPKLVLLDIFMPHKSGVIVFQQMKKDPELANIPVIVVSGASSITGVDLTTGEQQDTKNAGDDFARGMGAVIKEKLDALPPDGFVEKPVNASELLEKMKALLG